jgi:hypothetical protein
MCVQGTVLKQNMNCYKKPIYIRVFRIFDCSNLGTLFIVTVALSEYVLMFDLDLETLYLLILWTSVHCTMDIASLEYISQDRFWVHLT